MRFSPQTLKIAERNWAAAAFGKRLRLFRGNRSAIVFSTRLADSGYRPKTNVCLGTLLWDLRARDPRYDLRVGRNGRNKQNEIRLEIRLLSSNQCLAEKCIRRGSDGSASNPRMCARAYRGTEKDSRAIMLREKRRAPRGAAFPRRAREEEKKPFSPFDPRDWRRVAA